MGRPRGWAAARAGRPGDAFAGAASGVQAGTPGSGSGWRSPGECRVRTPALRLVCPRQLVPDGSATAGGSGRSAWPRCGGGTCRSRSGRKSRSCASGGAVSARLPGVWAGRRRRSRGSFAATPATSGWRASVMGRGGSVARGPAGTPPEGGETGREPGPARLRARPARRHDHQARWRGCAGPGLCAGSGAGHGPRADRRWARSWRPEQIATGPRIDFPDDESMRVSHEAIYQALYVQGRGGLRRELTARLGTGRALRFPGGARAGGARSS